MDDSLIAPPVDWAQQDSQDGQDRTPQPPTGAIFRQNSDDLPPSSPDLENGSADPFARFNFDFDARDQSNILPAELRGIRYKGKQYLIRKIQERERVRFENRKMSSIRFADQGNLASLTGGAEERVVLLSMCLYEIGVGKVGRGETHKLVSETELLGWEPAYVAELFEAAKMLSGLEQPTRKTKEQRLAEAEKDVARLRKELEEDARRGNPTIGGDRTTS